MPIEIARLLSEHGITARGVVHGGAHRCEEMPDYRDCGLTEADVLWFEPYEALAREVKAANPKLVISAHALAHVSGRCVLRLTNNIQSSSLLPLKTHAAKYPEVVVVKEIEVRATRLDDFYRRAGIAPDRYNVLNLDVQGFELQALIGCGELIHHFDAVYCEVNREELYEGCAMVGELDEHLREVGPFERVWSKWTGAGWGDAFYRRRA